MGKLIKILAVVFVLAFGLFSIVSLRMIRDRAIAYDISLNDTVVPVFDTVEFPFEHQHDAVKSLPFAASSIIDIDGDGIEEVFLGGGYSQQDHIFKFENGQMLELPGVLPARDNANASLGSIAFDTDYDNDIDLLVTRRTGIWHYVNSNGKFTAELLDAQMPAGTTPLSVAIADINRDGKFDMFVSGYINVELVEGQNIFNKEGYGGTSILFLNNGDNSFTDVTQQYGLLYKHNTFQGLFVDLDNDGWEDLVVAHDTGQVRTWRNENGSKFTNMPNPNSEQWGYPMGIAVSDYDNDGLVDLFFSNVGSTPPRFIVTGDLREDQPFNPKWIMFRNLGDFKFEDVAQQVKLADYEFSWGAVFEDLNLDGRDDLIVSENYIGFPPHKPPFLRLPGRLLVQTSTGEFAAVGEQAGVLNYRFSISPLVADFNQDGAPDIVHVNIGGKSKAFFSKKAEGNYLKVLLPNNVKSIGAEVVLERSDGQKLHQRWIVGEGLCSDSSHTLIFGLGNSEPKRLEVHYIDGRSEVRENLNSNSQIDFRAAPAA